ncbi:MAG: prepilin-type N-terminal cleavage/methylation domain-containing protein [Alphaproteobacteria bacterium]
MNRGAGHILRRRRNPCSRAGFTLLEMLVAITLLALIALVLTGALGFGARVWETGERGSERTRVVAVQRLLFQWLQQAEQMRMPGEDDAPLRGVFEGNPLAVRLIGVQPGIGLPGGYYLSEVYLRESEDGGALVLRRRFVQPVEDGLVDAAPDENTGEERVLLDNVAAVDFAYFGRETAASDPAWLESWGGRLDLPALVRIRLRFEEGDGRDWPELIVPLAMAGY